MLASFIAETTIISVEVNERRSIFHHGLIVGVQKRLDYLLSIHYNLRRN